MSAEFLSCKMYWFANVFMYNDIHFVASIVFVLACTDAFLHRGIVDIEMSFYSIWNARKRRELLLIAPLRLKNYNLQWVTKLYLLGIQSTQHPWKNPLHRWRKNWHKFPVDMEEAYQNRSVYSQTQISEKRSPSPVYTAQILLGRCVQIRVLRH